MALALTQVCTRPTGVAGGVHLRASSSQHSRGAPLVAPVLRSSTGGAAVSRRERAALSVTAFQLGNKKWWEAKPLPNVVHIGSVQQMVDAMATAGDRLVIVKFFAPWCAACKAMYPKLMKTLEERPDVLMLAVNFDENKTLVKALGIKVLPFFLFYRGAQGKLEGFSASAKRIALIQDALDRHSTPRCYLRGVEEEPVLTEFPKVLPSKGRANLDAVGVDSGEPQAEAEAAGLRPQPQPVS